MPQTATEDLHQSIRDAVKAMQIDLWAPLTASECDLVKRALSAQENPVQTN